MSTKKTDMGGRNEPWSHVAKRLLPYRVARSTFCQGAKSSPERAKF